MEVKALLCWNAYQYQWIFTLNVTVTRTFDLVAPKPTNQPTGSFTDQGHCFFEVLWHLMPCLK